MKPTTKKTAGSGQVLKKHVAAIHIGAKLSFLQRKLVNALLYHAYDELLTSKEHTISTSILCEMIGFDSKNVAYLKGALKGLMETVVEFDVLEDDGQSSWEAMVLLPYAKIKGGNCTYRYERALAEKLYHPDVYSKINLSVLREMNSAHALVLYENCYRYLDIGHTAWWDVDVFRKLMAVDMMSSYKPFKALNRNVIQPAIKEVNKLSNIQVEMETRMKGRSVTGMRFIVKPNPQLSLIGMEEDDELANSPAYEALLAEGISKTLARAWLLEHGEEYVRSKLSYANDQAAHGRIKASKVGFLKSAIEEDFKSEKETDKARKKAANQARDNRYAQERELARQKDMLRDIERAYREHCVAIIQLSFNGLDEGQQTSMHEAFAETLNEKIFKTEFAKNGWKSRTNFSKICEFWTAREITLPSLEDFSSKADLSNPDDLRKQIQSLEDMLSKPYQIAI